MPWTATGRTAAPVSSASRPAALRLRQRAGSVAGSLGKMQRLPPLQDLAGGDQSCVRLSAPDGVGAEAVEDPALPAPLEELDLRHVVEPAGATEAGADHERVEEAAVVRGDDQGPLDLAVLPPESRA